MKQRDVVNIELSRDEVQLLLRSLQHCLSTCEKKTVSPEEVCEECDTAKDLSDRLRRGAEA